MDFSRWPPLIAAVLALAIAVKVVLRPAKRREHWFFVGFASNVAVWYLATFLAQGEGRGSWLDRFAGLAAVLLPQTGVRFLRAFRLGAPVVRGALDRWAAWLLVPALSLVASPWYASETLGAPIRALISAYVVGLLTAGVSALYSRGRDLQSRQERRRVFYIVGVGVVATLVTTADLVPFVLKRAGDAAVPPVGSILVLAVLYLLSEVVERRRVIDLYELAGRFVVLTALALVLAGIYYRLVDWQRLAQHARPGEGPYFLNAIVASVVILIVVDPLKAEAESRISRFFFGERYDFERAVSEIRDRLAHTLELDTLGRELTDGLDRSRRVTDATLWLVDADRRMLEPAARLGTETVTRVELAAQRALIDHLRLAGYAVRDQLDREREDRAELGDTRGAEALVEVSRAVGDLGGGVVLPLRSDGGDLLGALALRDDRVRDAFSTDEVLILRSLAAQVAIVLENSRLHARIKERDRLAALGEMAAGMAHEIRNPLGGIKAAAQFLEGGMAAPEQQREFLGIIVEEVGRLDRVVTSVLDYARPYRGNPSVVEVNDVVERTVLLVKNDLPTGVTLSFEPGESVPSVRVDAEHLRQVLLNLVRNAVDAMSGVGAVTVKTLARGAATASTPGDDRAGGSMAEIVVKDTGPGINPTVRKNLFIPFFTTKAKGTGLGLAISQRLIESAGGRLEVRASGPRGTTFVVTLPAAGTIVTAPSLPPPGPLPGVPTVHG